MTLQLIGLGAARLACGYRLWVSFREPPTLWRTAFTVGIVCAALGVTLQSFSPQVDALTAPSVGSLLNHLVIIVGLASVQVYSTIRARCASPARIDDDRVHRVSSSRSPSRKPNAGAGRFATPL